MYMYIVAHCVHPTFLFRFARSGDAEVKEFCRANEVCESVSECVAPESCCSPPPHDGPLRLKLGVDKNQADSLAVWLTDSCQLQGNIPSDEMCVSENNTWLSSSSPSVDSDSSVCYKPPVEKDSWLMSPDKLTVNQPIDKVVCFEYDNKMKWLSDQQEVDRDFERENVDDVARLSVSFKKQMLAEVSWLFAPQASSWLEKCCSDQIQKDNGRVELGVSKLCSDEVIVMAGSVKEWLVD